MNTLGAYTVVSPFSMVSLSLVSLTCGQPRSKNVKWKIPEITSSYLLFLCIYLAVLLQHTGSLSRHLVSFAAAHGLSRCGVHQLSSCHPQAWLLCGPWDLSSPTRDWTLVVPCIVRWILNHWTISEIPKHTFYIAWHSEQCHEICCCPEPSSNDVDHPVIQLTSSLSLLGYQVDCRLLVSQLVFE